jgi:SAM-dependent methyltransferase
LTAEAFPDWRYAPNITGHPAVYETENRALDQAGHVLDALWALAPWTGKTVVDLGCGTGYWLGRYAEQAHRVIGIEPAAGLRAQAERAAAELAGPGRPGRPEGAPQTPMALSPPRLRPEVEVRAGSAEHTGLPDACADVVHARFAYFFPPGTDAGLTEALRVLRPGGQLIAVDNDYRWGEFSRLLAAGMTRPPGQVAAEVDDWWRARGATRHPVRSELSFASPADLAAVLHIELPAPVARSWLARNPLATGLTYGYVLFRVTRPLLRLEYRVSHLEVD